AIRAMRMALAASGTPEDAAWASYQLGELFWNSGRPGAAARAYHSAIRLDASFIPPHAGLAKVAWAQGDVSKAIRSYRWVTVRYPLPEYVIALGDLYRSTGDERDAARTYALVHVEERLFRAAGVNVDLELSLLDADHG